MSCNDISYIVISMQPPPHIQILRFCLGQRIEANFMGNIVFQRFKKPNVFFSELIFGLFSINLQISKITKYVQTQEIALCSFWWAENIMLNWFVWGDTYIQDLYYTKLIILCWLCASWKKSSSNPKMYKEKHIYMMHHTISCVFVCLL